MRIQTTAIKAPASALQAEQSRRATRWRAIAYSTAIFPFLLTVALAWLRPGFYRTEIPDWKPVLALADALWEKGDLYEARHLYLQVDRIASWQQDWEGLTAAACGIKRLDGAEGPYSKTFAILVRAMRAAESQQSRAGITAVARAFAAIGQGKAATMVLSRTRPDWPEEMQESADIGAVGCWEPDARNRPTRERSKVGSGLND
jgi:hypothetical protein